MKGAVQTPSYVEQDAKCDWQEETTKPANHSNQSTNSANVMGVVYRDVLVDSCFTKAHHKAKNNRQCNEHSNTDAELKIDGTVDTRDRIARLRIAQNKQHRERNNERQIHDETSAPLI